MPSTDASFLETAALAAGAAAIRARRRRGLKRPARPTRKSTWRCWAADAAAVWPIGFPSCPTASWSPSATSTRTAAASFAISSKQRTANGRKRSSTFARCSIAKTSTPLAVATPDHWHAPVTIHACAAGKDVYVEKPASHNIAEGRLAVTAARKFGCIVQHGTQLRAAPHYQEAWKLVRDGVDRQTDDGQGHQQSAAAPARTFHRRPGAGRRELRLVARPRPRPAVQHHALSRRLALDVGLRHGRRAVWSAMRTTLGWRRGGERSAPGAALMVASGQPVVGIPCGGCLGADPVAGVAQCRRHDRERRVVGPAVGNTGPSATTTLSRPWTRPRRR